MNNNKFISLELKHSDKDKASVAKSSPFDNNFTKFELNDSFRRRRCYVQTNLFIMNKGLF